MFESSGTVLDSDRNEGCSAHLLITESRRLLVSVFLLSGCHSDLTQPGPQRPQWVEEISVTTKVWWDVSPPEGILTLSTRAADASFRANVTTRLRVDLRSSSGDIEEAFFQKTICETEPGHDARRCHQLFVAMEEGSHVQNLHSRLRTLPGRYTTSPSIGRFAGIQLFDISYEDASRKVRGWPGVRYVEPSGAIYPPWLTIPVDQWLGGVLESNTMLDVVTPVIGNGKLELLEGDTVTIRYTQPDSSIYTKSYVLPTRP